MKKTVLVTAIGSFSAEAVIRGCKRRGFRVLGCDIYPAEWIGTPGETDGFWQAPLASDRREYLEFLTRVCREEQVDYLVPLTDAEIDVINEARDGRGMLAGVSGGTAAGGPAGERDRNKPWETMVCLSPVSAIRRCRNKWEASRFLESRKACGVIPARRLGEVIREEGDTGYELMSYPLIIKPENGRSSQGLVIVPDAERMRYEVERLEFLADLYLVQPMISGYVVTVDVVRSPATGQVVCLPRRELLRTPNGAGTSVCVFRNEKLEAEAAAAARSLDIRGCVNMEFIEESQGNWRFLECNPRFSGGVAFSCLAGYDMIENHFRCFEGSRIEPLGPIRTQYLVKRYGEYRTKTE